MYGIVAIDTLSLSFGWYICENFASLVNHLDWTSAHLHRPIIESGLCHFCLLGKNSVNIENHLRWTSAHLQQPMIKRGTNQVFLEVKH